MRSVLRRVDIKTRAGWAQAVTKDMTPGSDVKFWRVACGVWREERKHQGKHSRGTYEVVWCDGHGHSESVKMDAKETIKVVGGQSSSGDDWRLREEKRSPRAVKLKWTCMEFQHSKIIDILV